MSDRVDIVRESGVYTFRGSKIAKLQYFTDRAAAMDAAGLTEEQVRQEAT